MFNTFLNIVQITILINNLVSCVCCVNACIYCFMETLSLINYNGNTLIPGIFLYVNNTYRYKLVFIITNWLIHLRG